MPSRLHKDIALSVVAYEAKLRGCSKGQACFELVMEAADTGSYPQQLRERLARLKEESAAHAIECALRQSVEGG